MLVIKIMFLQASKIIGLPIGILETRSKNGSVENIIVDLKTNKIIALLIKESGLFSKRKCLSVEDIVDFDHQAIVIRNQNNLLEIKEIVRANKIVRDNNFILGMRAQNKNKKNIGKVYDFVFNNENFLVEKFYVRNWINEIILPKKNLIKIDNKILIFRTLVKN